MAMMISKFHKIIQSKVVWTVFAILISVAFVGVYTGSRGSGQKTQAQRNKEAVGRLFGQDISRAEFSQAYHSIYAMSVLGSGRMIDITSEIDDLITERAWQRLAILKKADQLGLSVSAEQTIQAIQSHPLFMDRQTGQFDKQSYDMIISSLLPRLRMSPKGFEKLWAENTLIDKATSMATQGALVTEEEIKKAFHLYNDTVTAEYVIIPQSLSRMPTVTDEDIVTYFEENKEDFRMPEKALVEYVAYPIAEYTNLVAVSTNQVAQFYENNKQRYLKPAAEDAAEGAEPEYQTLEEVQGAIKIELLEALARQVAAQEADKLVAMLSEEGMTFKLAAEKSERTIVTDTPSFAQTDHVQGVDETAPFARAAFGLEQSDTHYYSDPVIGRDTVYVIALVKKLPSFIPTYDAVRMMARMKAKSAAGDQAYKDSVKEISEKIKTAIKEGATFADAVKKYNMPVRNMDPFNANSTQDGEIERNIMAATLALDVNSVVGPIDSQTGALMAHVAKREASEESALEAMRPQLVAQIERQKAARIASAWQDSLLEEGNFEDLLNKSDDDS